MNSIAFIRPGNVIVRVSLLKDGLCDWVINSSKSLWIAINKKSLSFRGVLDSAATRTSIFEVVLLPKSLQLFGNPIFQNVLVILESLKPSNKNVFGRWVLLRNHMNLNILISSWSIYSCSCKSRERFFCNAWGRCSFCGHCWFFNSWGNCWFSFHFSKLFWRLVLTNYLSVKILIKSLINYKNKLYYKNEVS